jgi:hypothetical protein
MDPQLSPFFQASSFILNSLAVAGLGIDPSLVVTIQKSEAHLAYWHQKLE